MSAEAIWIETPRLLIRELRPEDAEGMYLMDSDPEVHRYVGKKPLNAPEESRAVIEFIRQQYREQGIGRWAMLEQKSGDFVGWIGFKRILERTNGYIHHIDFGYRLARRYWGKGLASEAGRAVLDFGLDVLHLKAVYAMTHPDNAASRRVLEKLGFRLQGLFAYDATPGWMAAGEPATWYQLIDPRVKNDG